MEKWILLILVDPDLNVISSLEEIAICDSNGALKVWDSFDEAKDYQEDHGISGQVIELPAP